MGVSLATIGNHDIDFSSGFLKDISISIKNKLDNMVIKNSDSFIKWSQLKWEAFNCKITDERMEKILKRKDWDYEIHNDDDWQEIDFYGPLYLELSFNKTYIKIWDPPDRYENWFLYNGDSYRNEWRKYFKTIVNTFSGDRVIYLPDNLVSSSIYLDFEGTYKELERNLKKEYGFTKKNINDIKEKDFSNGNYLYYYVDELEDID